MPVVSFAEAQELLSRGEFLVFPTETVFGIGCSACSQLAVDSILSLKSRDYEAGMPVIVSDTEVIERFVVDASESLANRRKALQEKYWPGALSMVVDIDSSAGLAKGVMAKDSSVAVRLSPLKLTRDLAKAAGGFLVATSANRKDEKPVISIEEALATFPDIPIVEGAESLNPLPSTIIDIRGEQLKVLRQGAVEIEI